MSPVRRATLAARRPKTAPVHTPHQQTQKNQKPEGVAVLTGHCFARPLPNEIESGSPGEAPLAVERPCLHLLIPSTQPPKEAPAEKMQQTTVTNSCLVQHHSSPFSNPFPNRDLERLTSSLPREQASSGGYADKKIWGGGILSPARLGGCRRWPRPGRGRPGTSG